MEEITLETLHELAKHITVKMHDDGIELIQE